MGFSLFWPSSWNGFYCSSGDILKVFGCDRWCRHGCTVRREVEIGVLADESDDGELIQIHDVFSSELVLICLKCLGAPQRRTSPLPSGMECFVGGTAI